VDPNSCIKCGVTVEDSSWELEWEGDNVVAFFHCPNPECEVEVWKSIFRFDGQEIFSPKEEDDNG
jgi:hypothetical protein